MREWLSNLSFQVESWNSRYDAWCACCSLVLYNKPFPRMGSVVLEKKENNWSRFYFDWKHDGIVRWILTISDAQEPATSEWDAFVLSDHRRKVLPAATHVVNGILQSVRQIDNVCSKLTFHPFDFRWGQLMTSQSPMGRHPPCGSRLLPGRTRRAISIKNDGKDMGKTCRNGKADAEVMWIEGGQKTDTATTTFYEMRMN